MFVDGAEDSLPATAPSKSLAPQMGLSNAKIGVGRQMYPILAGIYGDEFDPVDHKTLDSVRSMLETKLLKVLKELSDGFIAIKKKSNTARTSAAPDDLFVVNEDAEKLSDEGATAFHNLVAKTLYVSKRARPDVSTAIAFLTTRVRAPDTDDWDKLCHLMEYLRGDCDRPLILGADNDGLLMWYVDASFAVHPNMRGHTGGGLTLGRGFPITVSTKQKLNTRSSTESELVGVDDMMPIICWTRYFLLSQGYGIIENLLLQDNRSSILLERNGRASSGKRTRHINIRYYFISDRVNMKEISIDWCPTKKMVSDYMSKPLQGSLFRELRDYIMGRVRCLNAQQLSTTLLTDSPPLHRLEPMPRVTNISRTRPMSKIIEPKDFEPANRFGN